VVGSDPVAWNSEKCI